MSTNADKILLSLDPRYRKCLGCQRLINANLSYGFILKFLGTGWHRNYRKICFVCVFNVCYRKIPDNLILSTIDKIYGNLFYVTTKADTNFHHTYKFILHPHPYEPPTK